MSYNDEPDGCMAILAVCKWIVCIVVFCILFNGANEAYELMEQPSKDFAWYVLAMLVLLFVTK
jgi:hypothetical protein